MLDGSSIDLNGNLVDGNGRVEYIEVDYNRTRRDSANGYISPEAFEARKVA